MYYEFQYIQTFEKCIRNGFSRYDDAEFRNLFMILRQNLKQYPIFPSCHAGPVKCRADEFSTEKAKGHSCLSQSQGYGHEARKKYMYYCAILSGFCLLVSLYLSPELQKIEKLRSKSQSHFSKKKNKTENVLQCVTARLLKRIYNTLSIPNVWLLYNFT